MEEVKSTHESLRLVIPGDEVTDVEQVEDGVNLILGPGLAREGSRAVCNRCGILRKKMNPKVAVFWVDCHSKRYVASRGENVIGVIIGKAGDSFRVR